MRPDGFTLGQDPEEKQEREVIAAADGGCKRCGRSWPTVTFHRSAETLREWQSAGIGPSGPAPEKMPDPICDRCQGDPALNQAIEEATTGTIPGLIRSVEVTGIESKTNVASFKYATHIGDKELVTTLLNVAFKTKVPGEFVWYVYRNVPLAVCEAWFAAPAHGQSHGAYFASFVKASYDCEKKS